jgi:hypothetical protein
MVLKMETHPNPNLSPEGKEQSGCGAINSHPKPVACPCTATTVSDGLIAHDVEAPKLTID